MNTEIFSHWDTACIAMGIELKNTGMKRYVKSSKEDDDFSARAILESVHFQHTERQVATCRHGDKLYFCFIGFRFLGNLDEYLEFQKIDLTPGILTVLVHGQCLSLLPSGELLRDVLDVGHIGGPDPYDGHDFRQIEKLFSSVVVFEANTPDVTELSARIFKFCLYEKQNDMSLLNESLASKISHVLDLDIEELPHETLARSLFDADPGSFFLALYRCLEAIYSVNACKKLAADLGFKGDWKEISKSLEETLTWKPKEQESLQKLFASLDQPTIEKLINAIDRTDKLNTSDFAAKCVYNLRNNLVHFRPATQLLANTKNIEWPDLFDGMLSAIEQIYLDL